MFANTNKVFLIAFVSSAAIHGVILFNNLNFGRLSDVKREQKIEVSYVKIPQKKEPPLNLSSKITMQKRIPPPYIDKETIFNKSRALARQDAAFKKPALIKPDIIAIKKKITLPPINTDKINNPSYISYYQIVREKIRRSAYYNYTRTETGEVYISFIISSEGYLKDVRLVSEKSSLSTYLRETALRSVRDASPFPNFPKELDYPHLSFNVVISFEIE